MTKKTKAEYKKVAEGLYKRLEIAVEALDKAQVAGSSTAEEKAELRIKALEDKITELGKPKEEEDELVCPECGADVIEVEKGVYYCEDCKKYFEEEEQ